MFQYVRPNEPIMFLLMLMYIYQKDAISRTNLRRRRAPSFVDLGDTPPANSQNSTTSNTTANTNATANNGSIPSSSATNSSSCPSACSGNGYCLLGTCLCMRGYKGDDCATGIYWLCCWTLITVNKLVLLQVQKVTPHSHKQTQTLSLLRG